METFESVYMLSGAINTIFKLLTVVACILLFSKNRNAGTILMLLASILSIFFSIGSVLVTSLAANYSAEGVVKYNALVNLIGQIPVIMFTVGLMLLAMQYRKKPSVD